MVTITLCSPNRKCYVKAHSSKWRIAMSYGSAALPLPRITRIIFDIIPSEKAGQRFLTPHAYIFRGILLGWLDQYNHELASEIHQKQPKATLLHYGDYSLFQRTLYLTAQGWTDASNYKMSNQGNSNRNNPQGLRYTLNLFDSALSQAFLGIILSHQDQTIQFGPQEGIISKVTLETVNLDSFVRQILPIHSISVDFISPVSFAVMGAEGDLRFPLHDYFFKYLFKLWNYLVKDSPVAIKEEFITWVKEAISETSFEFHTVAWEMGKEKKFVGGKGWVTYVVHKQHPVFSYWLDILTRFGQYSGVGNGRSAGFGLYRIGNTDFDSKTAITIDDLLRLSA